MEADATLGAWVRAARRAVTPKLSLEALAEATGVKLSAVQALETQSRPLAEVPMRRIAERLSLDADELLLRSGMVPADVKAWLAAHPDHIRAVREMMAAQAS